MRHDGEMVQALLDEQTNDAIGVEDEVCALGVFVPDHCQKGDELRGLRQDVDVGLVDFAGDGGGGLFGVGAVGGPYAYGWGGAAVRFVGSHGVVGVFLRLMGDISCELERVASTLLVFDGKSDRRLAVDSKQQRCLGSRLNDLLEDYY